MSQVRVFFPSGQLSDLLTDTQILTYGLSVNIPASYRSTADINQLGTIWLAYIPSSDVNPLAAAIKVSSSAFYTGVSNQVAQTLAAHVVSGFNIDSVSQPSTAGNGGNSVPDESDSSSGGVSDSGNGRKDAIIGVVSALGAVALCVLSFLIYRSVQRRRELRHHRLSDPPNAEAWNAGIRQQGRDFDQDSVGGQRRRSFYFAEDSLRSFSHVQNPGQDMTEAMRTSPTSGVTQRRVLPAAISAPRLQESTMNW